MNLLYIIIVPFCAYALILGFIFINEKIYIQNVYGLKWVSLKHNIYEMLLDFRKHCFYGMIRI